MLSTVMYVPVHACIAGQVELRFGDRVVRNNSYIRRGDIPGGPGGVNGLLCASDTTNPATRQWYDRDGDTLGTTEPSNGAYQAIDSASGGVLLYIAGTIDTGLHYCRISDSSGNIQTLYAGHVHAYNVALLNKVEEPMVRTCVAHLPELCN